MTFLLWFWELVECWVKLMRYIERRDEEEHFLYCNLTDPDNSVASDGGSKWWKLGRRRVHRSEKDEVSKFYLSPCNFGWALVHWAHYFVVYTTCLLCTPPCWAQQLHLPLGLNLLGPTALFLGHTPLWLVRPSTLVIFRIMDFNAF